jgi:DNA-binding LacI/PurR family transcriptional regulator
VDQIVEPKLPDAIFCANDFLALQILRGLKLRGFSVPRDVSLMGFDDMELAAYSEPPLTTITVDKLAIGKKAAELALLGLRGGARSSGAHHILSVQLLERASVAKKIIGNLTGS